MPEQMHQSTASDEDPIEVSELSTAQEPGAAPQADEEIGEGSTAETSPADADEPVSDAAADGDVEPSACPSAEEEDLDQASEPSIADVVERLDVLSEQFKSRIARSEYEDQMLKRYSDEIHEYRADLFKKITLPLIKEIIGVRDAACAMIERASDQDASRTSSIDSIAFLRDMLETALDNYGVTVHESQIGALPVKGADRPIGRVKTADSAAHGTIAAVLNDAYFMDGKCISPAKVKVFAFESPEVLNASVQHDDEIAPPHDAAEHGSDAPVSESANLSE